MQKKFNIEVDCANCAAKIETAIKQLDGVTNAEVSHKTGTAVVTLNQDVSDDVLKQAVAEQGYEVTDIQ